MLKTDEGDERLAGCGEEQRPYETPGHSSREGEVVITRELLLDIRERRAVDQDIVCGLYIKGLLDLGIRRDDEMERHHCYQEQAEEKI